MNKGGEMVQRKAGVQLLAKNKPPASENLELNGYRLMHNGHVTRGKGRVENGRVRSKGRGLSIAGGEGPREIGKLGKWKNGKMD